VVLNLFTESKNETHQRSCPYPTLRMLVNIPRSTSYPPHAERNFPQTVNPSASFYEFSRHVTGTVKCLLEARVRTSNSTARSTYEQLDLPLSSDGGEMLPLLSEDIRGRSSPASPGSTLFSNKHAGAARFSSVDYHLLA